MPEQATAPMGDFPPYGFLNNTELEDIQAIGVIPSDWDGDAQSYEAWFKTTLDLINDVLWPRFDPFSKQWIGRSTATMRELTEVDLAILRQMQTERPQELDKEITTPLGWVGRLTHREIFKIEDGGNLSSFGSYYSHYDPTLSAVTGNLTRLMSRGFSAKAAEADMKFKLQLQRPRPFRMAMVLGLSDYRYLEAFTANTPAMICGHCLQGLLMIGAFIEDLIRARRKLSHLSWEALEQYAVDIGDRRVMAGLHYPSDALSSWIVALKMADHVFREPAVKERLRSAIHRGFVYKAIVASGQPVYQAALKALEAS